MKTFNTKIESARQASKEYLDFLIEKGSIVQIKDVKKTRTNVQNSALWLYFTQCANALNDIGHYNNTETITGEVLELQWTKDTFKSEIWIKLQIAAYGTNSTTKLNTDQITPIYDTILIWMNGLGVQVYFPKKFSRYLDAMG